MLQPHKPHRAGGSRLRAMTPKRSHPSPRTPTLRRRLPSAPRRRPQHCQPTTPSRLTHRREGTSSIAAKRLDDHSHAAEFEAVAIAGGESAPWFDRVVPCADQLTGCRARQRQTRNRRVRCSGGRNAGNADEETARRDRRSGSPPQAPPGALATCRTSRAGHRNGDGIEIARWCLGCLVGEGTAAAYCEPTTYKCDVSW